MSDNQVTEPSETTTPRCEHCGSHHIIDFPPGCPMCGAPNCCQVCCKTTRLETERDQLRAELAKLQSQYASDKERGHKYRDKLTAELAKAQEERDRDKKEHERVIEVCKQLNRDRNTYFDQGCRNLARAKEVETKLVTLTAALDKAREDSKRLDWLEMNATSELKIDSNGTFVWLDQWRQKYTSFYQWSGPTLRAAIDAAKGAE